MKAYIPEPVAYRVHYVALDLVGDALYRDARKPAVPVQQPLQNVWIVPLEEVKHDVPAPFRVEQELPLVFY